VEIRTLAISLPLDDIKCLVAAEGYVELDMYEEALAELQQTSPLCRQLPLVRNLEFCVCAGLKQRQLITARRLRVRRRNRKPRIRRSFRR
jgi:hypothetical protein